MEGKSRAILNTEVGDYVLHFEILRSPFYFVCIFYSVRLRELGKRSDRYITRSTYTKVDELDVI